MDNLIVGVVLVVILHRAIGYIIKEKKKGVRCIGCPYAGECVSKGKDSGTCGCQADDE